MLRHIAHLANVRFDPLPTCRSWKGRVMRHVLLTLAFAGLPCCSAVDDPQQAEARAELTKMFPELSNAALKLRRVRRVEGSVCGEFSNEPEGHSPIFRLFTYRKGKDATIDLRRGAALTTAGGCPIRDDILAICAPTQSEREEAETRRLQCRLRGDI